MLNIYLAVLYTFPNIIYAHYVHTSPALLYLKEMIVFRTLSFEAGKKWAILDVDGYDERRAASFFYSLLVSFEKKDGICSMCI